MFSALLCACIWYNEKKLSRQIIKAKRGRRVRQWSAISALWSSSMSYRLFKCLILLGKAWALSLLLVQKRHKGPPLVAPLTSISPPMVFSPLLINQGGHSFRIKNIKKITLSPLWLVINQRKIIWSQYLLSIPGLWYYC